MLLLVVLHVAFNIQKQTIMNGYGMPMTSTSPNSANSSMLYCLNRLIMINVDSAGQFTQILSVLSPICLKLAADLFEGGTLKRL